MAAKKNQIVLDLGQINLTPAARKRLQNEIHKTVSAQLQTIKNVAPKAVQPAAVGATPPTMTAHIQATITSANPGVTALTATLNGTQQTLNQSGTLTFQGVQSDDVILIQVDSLGTATITIDVAATPAQMNFPPGAHSKSFIIN